MIVGRRNQYGIVEQMEVSDDFFNTSDNLIYKCPSHIVRLPKGSWDIMDVLVDKILKYNPGPVVEIGMGESTTIFAKHAAAYGVTLYSCDIKMGGMFNVFAEPLFPGHICFIGRSEDFIRQFEGDEPAIVFLDGEHRFDTVKSEIDFFLPLLKKDGVMFLHDTFPPHEMHLIKDSTAFKPGDVYLARQMLENNPDVDCFTWPYSAHGMGLTMAIKHGLNIDRPYWKKNGRLYETVKS